MDVPTVAELFSVRLKRKPKSRVKSAILSLRLSRLSTRMNAEIIRVKFIRSWGTMQLPVLSLI
jgi:hypothetical protein